MARRNNESTLDSDRAKVRVLFTEVEGSNASVQEALKAIVSAMSRPAGPSSEQRANGASALPTEQRDPKEIEGAIDQPDEGEGTTERATDQSARKPHRTGKKVDRNATLRLVPDLDFMPQGRESLKDFMQNKSPRTELELALAAVFYMQNFMNVAKIGPSHVMTALKDAGIAVPVDLKGTIRKAKRSKMWLNFTDIEEIRVTTQGGNHVEHEMPKSV
ncbi:MAG: hypothetical protein ACREE5_06300 [Acetobacteraceae bacterium]